MPTGRRQDELWPNKLLTLHFSPAEGKFRDDRWWMAVLLLFMHHKPPSRVITSLLAALPIATH